MLLTGEDGDVTMRKKEGEKMYTVENSRHFTKRTDPVSGMPYYILSTRLAPVQQGFYFVNSGFSDDGRYFWFYYAFPPAPAHGAGVIDLATDEIALFPETAGTGDAIFMVDGQNGDLWWGNNQGYFRRSPDPKEKPVRIAPLPEIATHGRLTSAGTHLTFSPDRKFFFVDIGFGDRSTLGAIEVATGKYTEWFQTPLGVPYNHAQWNPVDPNLVLCAHEHHTDFFTGEVTRPANTPDGVYPRLHTLTPDGKDTMYPSLFSSATHEWWSADGKKIYYVDGRHILRRNLETGAHEVAVDCGRFHNKEELPITAWHAYCTADERYFVSDASYYSHGGLRWWRGCPSKVTFYNTVTDRAVPIVTLNPEVSEWTPETPCPYHIDPHPRFVLKDKWITFTATVDGRVDVAVAPVKPLLEATQK